LLAKRGYFAVPWQQKERDDGAKCFPSATHFQTRRATWAPKDDLTSDGDKTNFLAEQANLDAVPPSGV
jgi:hypothetical protein